MQSLIELFLPTLMSDIVDKRIVLENIPYIRTIGGLLLLVDILGINELVELYTVNVVDLID